MKNTLYKSRSKVLLFGVILFISLFFVVFTSAQVSYNDCSIYGNCKPVTTISGNTGITGNYTILKDANLITLVKTYCFMNFTGGILVSSTC